MMTAWGSVARAIVALAVLAGGTATAHAQSDAAKASLKCRGVVAQKANALVKTALKVVDACHVSRLKGKFIGDCNDFTASDVKGRLAAAIAKLGPAIDKKCPIGEPVRDNYPAADVQAAISTSVVAEVEASGVDVQGSIDLAGDKVRLKCHKAIGKARTSIVAEILKLSLKCQKAADKVIAANTGVFGELAGNCVALPEKSGPKAVTAITKTCAGLTGADVGSCADIPSCIVASATATAQVLAGAIFGKPAECGNGAVETGEQCDDANLTDGDGCDSNCTTTACGNGIVTAGEQCDDGNALTSDACPACQPAVCGDGFVHAGVELCGDSSPTACANPTIATCNVTECTPSGTTRTLEVRIASPNDLPLSGLTVAVDYPETLLRIPGFSNESSVKMRIANLPGGLGEPNDQDFSLGVALASSGTFSSGRFFSVTFDECLGAPAATLDAFSCHVDDASDENAQTVNGVTCTIVAP